MPNFNAQLPRSSKQRQLVYDFLRESPIHPTAEEIFKGVRKKLVKISMGTVYRNLELLEQQGLIKPLYYCKDHVRYDANLAEPHYYFVCQECDKVESLFGSELLELAQQVNEHHEIEVADAGLFFYGLCVDCQKKNNKKERPSFMPPFYEN